MNPYSTRFVAQAEVAGATEYVVPSGSRAVVKCISVSKANTSVSTPQIRVGGVIIFTALLDASPTWQTKVWEGMAVAYAGEVVTVYGDGHSDVLVSGYLLTDSVP